jgi:hypothetical protein
LPINARAIGEVNGCAGLRAATAAGLRADYNCTGFYVGGNIGGARRHGYNLADTLFGDEREREQTNADGVGGRHRISRSRYFASNQHRL